MFGNVRGPDSFFSENPFSPSHPGSARTRGEAGGSTRGRERPREGFGPQLRLSSGHFSKDPPQLLFKRGGRRPRELPARSRTPPCTCLATRAGAPVTRESRQRTPPRSERHAGGRRGGRPSRRGVRPHPLRFPASPDTTRCGMSSRHDEVNETEENCSNYTSHQIPSTPRIINLKKRKKEKKILSDLSYSSARAE